MPLALISFKFLIFNLVEWYWKSFTKRIRRCTAWRFPIRFTKKNHCHEFIFNFPPTPLKMELDKNIFTVNMGRWWCLPSRIYNYFARRERSINYCERPRRVYERRKKKYQISSHCNLNFFGEWYLTRSSQKWASETTTWLFGISCRKKRFLS